MSSTDVDRISNRVPLDDNVDTPPDTSTPLRYYPRRLRTINRLFLASMGIMALSLILYVTALVAPRRWQYTLMSFYSFTLVLVIVVCHIIYYVQRWAYQPGVTIPRQMKQAFELMFFASTVAYIIVTGALLISRHTYAYMFINLISAAYLAANATAAVVVTSHLIDHK